MNPLYFSNSQEGINFRKELSARYHSIPISEHRAEFVAAIQAAGFATECETQYERNDLFDLIRKIESDNLGHYICNFVGPQSVCYAKTPEDVNDNYRRWQTTFNHYLHEYYSCEVANISEDVLGQFLSKVESIFEKKHVAAMGRGFLFPLLLALGFGLLGASTRARSAKENVELTKRVTNE